MKKLTCLLVHQDPDIRTELRKKLAEVKGVKILGEAVSSFEALEMLESIPYDVFFLGTELAGGVSGIEMAQILGQRKTAPILIFLAKDESLAFKGFELGATDYLLWPATVERLGRSIQRAALVLPPHREQGRGVAVPLQARSRGEEETLQLALGEKEEELFLEALRKAWDRRQARPVEIEKLPINQDGRLLLIPYSQIVFIEAYEDYSYVHTSGDKFLTSYRLKNLEERLRKHRFFRVHRKYLVNLEMVTEIASMPGSNFMLRTAGRKKIELPISRRRIGELKQLLNL
ncbi:LytR/AlgR family response regulator transcription factor [Desulfoplanes formicivorans]|uniref:DNA-binding response regulator n=1 Tax=Desulfoplanes formicivorans TaxID=1592317 RepID=A0A194AFT6_9BACT|nr:LytTR family DNA-binding domain-containing protein [Desulfoplanes formicivorans]GAU07946.1 DNA-binding response regulator [Desulfoplanes formicivorans]